MLFRSVDHWVSTSRHNAAEVAAHFHQPVSVLYSGVDTDQFRPGPRRAGWRAARGVPEGALLIASLGRLVGLKGLRIVVEALAGTEGDIHFLIIGEGPEEAALRMQAREAGIAERVHFHGRAAHADLPALLCEIDLLVQPSIGVEAFGIAVVEAMACGVPVLASDLGGLRETVVEGLTGRLLPQADVPAWRSALLAAENDRATLSRWGSNGRLRVEGEFTWIRNAGGLVRLLDPASPGGRA
mgnify:CR=1 FL=1